MATNKWRDLGPPAYEFSYSPGAAANPYNLPLAIPVKLYPFRCVRRDSSGAEEFVDPRKNKSDIVTISAYSSWREVHNILKTTAKEAYHATSTRGLFSRMAITLHYDYYDNEEAVPWKSHNHESVLRLLRQDNVTAPEIGVWFVLEWEEPLSIRTWPLGGTSSSGIPGDAPLLRGKTALLSRLKGMFKRRGAGRRVVATSRTNSRESSCSSG